MSITRKTMTYIIAEVGSNHDGDLDQALSLIQIASEAGCDAVKFQSYDAEKLVHPQDTALPQAQRAGYTSQMERFKDLQFTEEQWDLLIKSCHDLNIDFLTTPFDLESLERYRSKMKYIKIASGDLTYYKLLRAVCETGKPVILSTGMSRLDEIQEAAAHFPRDLLTVCHCVSLYPCPDSEANLGVIDDLQGHFPSVGYSDHTIGMTACLVAAGKGCTVIEKHITLDSTRSYGDHPLSLEPDELNEMVHEIRRIEKMLGNEKPSLKEDRYKLRRGAYARRPIEVGQVITEHDIIELRPRKSRDPHQVIGKRAHKDYKELEAIG
jgi:sialic acid synthase SpsE